MFAVYSALQKDRPMRKDLMKTKKNAESIEEIVNIIVERFQPEKIILFGSHAKGTAGPDSDLDLLVVMPVSGSKRDKQIEVRLALRDIHIPKDIIVVTPDELERYRNVVGTIIYPALREGKALYERVA